MTPVIRVSRSSGLLALFVGIVMLVRAVPVSAIACNLPPKQFSEDVRRATDAAALRIGAASIGGQGSMTVVEVQNLLAKYPNADRLYFLQMIGATLCSILNESSSVAPDQRIAYWISFERDGFALLGASVERSGDSRSPALPTHTTSASTPSQTPLSSTGGRLRDDEFITASREEWTQKFLGDFSEGSWNVIVGSFDINRWNYASGRVAELARRFPRVSFYLDTSLAADRTHPMFACYIANVPDKQTAQRIAAWARRQGIAPDAYVVWQHFNN